MVREVLVSKSLSFGVLLCASGCGDFVFEINVAPVSSNIQVFADNELVQEQTSNTIVVTRTFADYGEGMSKGHVAIRIVAAQMEVLSQTFTPQVCARDGDSWDSERIFLNVVEGDMTTIILSGFKCQNGDMTITGVP